MNISLLYFHPRYVIRTLCRRSISRSFLRENHKIPMEKSNVLIFGIGNPILDLIATVPKTFLVKYGLKANDVILAGAQHQELFSEIQRSFHGMRIPGGSANNTIKVAQWIIGRPGSCISTGCVSNDDHGRVLKDSAAALGVIPLYQSHLNGKSTGRCAVLVSGENRSIVAYLGATVEYTEDHLMQPEVWDYVEQARCIYVTGFFFTACQPAITRLAKFAHAEKKIFAMNLSATYICHDFADAIRDILPFIDIIFGNETEVAAITRNLQALRGDDADKDIDLRQKASILGSLHQADRPRLVVVTQGVGPVLMCQDGVITEYPVPKVPDEEILDTNGAGDAFVGGFLAQYVRGHPLQECIRCGIWVAQKVVRRTGCTLPEICDYDNI